jgi:hypothetical protein
MFWNLEIVLFSMQKVYDNMPCLSDLSMHFWNLLLFILRDEVYSQVTRFYSSSAWRAPAIWFFQSSFMSDKNWNSYILSKRCKKGRQELHLVGLLLVCLGSPSITIFLFSDFMEELWLWMYTVLNTNSGRTVNSNGNSYITVTWVVKKYNQFRLLLHVWKYSEMKTIHILLIIVL